MTIAEGDMVLIALPDGTDLIVQATNDGYVSTHMGNILFAELIGKEFGSFIDVGRRKAYLFTPGIVDHVFTLQRKTQVVYPKDMGYILLMLDVKAGDRVIECGTGSGAMTLALARSVGETGKVYSYEKNARFLKNAEENVRLFGLNNCVAFKNRDIEDGIEEGNADAFFLDVPDPLPVLPGMISALRGGGRFCIICPTANQVQDALKELRKEPCTRINVWETFVREMKTNPDRFRPEDKMVGHTTYLVFGTRTIWKES